MMKFITYNHNFWSIMFCMLLSASVYAQQDSTLIRTVVVENQYNPDILDANKISISPSIEEPEAVKKEIQYAETSHPATSFAFNPMKEFADNPEKEAACRGYARLGYGNNGNLDARLGYIFNFGKKDRLDAMFSLRGMNGTLEYPKDYSLIDWDARFYRTYLSADWQHLFDKFILRVWADGESSLFNYNPEVDGYNNSSRQNNTLASLQMSLSKSQTDEDEILFTAGTGVLYAAQKHAFGLSEKHSEIDIRTHVTVTGKITDESHICIKAQMDNFLYNQKEWAKQGNHTALRINPAYVLKKEKWNIRLGVHTFFSTDGRYKFQAAPDLWGAYNFHPNYQLYVHLNGSRSLNNLRTLTTLYPYDFPFEYHSNNDYSASISLFSPTYTPFDACVGVKASPMDELGLKLYGGFRIAKDELFSVIQNDIANWKPLHYLLQDDATSLYAGISAEYKLKNYMTTHAEFRWNHWNSDITDNYMTLHPELIFQWSADICPIERLHITPSYLYEKRHKAEEQRAAKAVNNVGVTCSYELLENVNVWVKGDNLLNKTYFQNALYPTQGINFLIGASVKF